MKRIIFIAVLFAMFAVCGIAYADDLEFSNVTFVNGSGVLVQNSPNVGDDVYATVTVKNITEEEKRVFLVAGCYKEGIMTDVFTTNVAVDAGESKPISTKIDINAEGLKVVANCLDFSDITRACIKPANLLVNSTDIAYITINGNRLEGYSNSKNSYSVTVNTPTADVKAVAQDSTTAINIKKIHLPGTVKVDVTSQFGNKRTITIDCSTTNPQPRPIEDVNVILRANYNDNTGRNIFDDETKIWSDLSGYGNDIPLAIDSNNKWISSGLYLTGGSENSETSSYMPQPVSDAINSYNCTIQFELAGISAVAGKKCAIMSSPNESFVIYQEQNTTSLYLKWGGASLTSWRPTITAQQALSGVNTIVIDNKSSLMSWYVNGTLLSSKELRSTSSLTDGIALSDFASGYGGAVTFKSITIYDRALSAEEIGVAE
ncbi:MAG: LamG domain-containing protein [Clostridiaceae bacterium]|nr:LamG domain-containing protein [Clostridiaceae bacterium]